MILDQIMLYDPILTQLLYPMIESVYYICVPLLGMLKAQFNWSKLERASSTLQEWHRNQRCTTYSVELFSRFCNAARELSVVMGCKINDFGPLYWYDIHITYTYTYRYRYKYIFYTHRQKTQYCIV